MRNRVFTSNKYAFIEMYSKLYERYFYTIIDIEDLEKVKDEAEYLMAVVEPHTAYALYKSKHDKKVKRLHRLIMDTPRHLEVDHINHKGWDNRKDNLRNCTHKENQQNRRKQKEAFNDPENYYHTVSKVWWGRCL